MRLHQLDIRRLPGLDDPFSLQPGPGVNLVVGPNASGKSSAARAVRDLLWPARHAGGVRWLRAVFHTDGQELTVTCDGGAPFWHRGAEPAAAPALPPAHLADCYRLVAADLLGEGGPFDRDLAAAIRTEMTGGFDLDGLAAALDRPSARGANDLERARRAARERTAAVERAQGELAARRDGLAELEERIAAADAAALRRAALETRRDLRTARLALDAARAEAATFPAVMDEVRPEDAETFAQLRRTAAERQARAAQLTAAADTHQQALAALGVPADTDASSLLEGIGKHVAACRGAAQAAALAAERRATLEHALQAAREADGADRADTLAALHRAAAGLDAGVAAILGELDEGAGLAPGRPWRAVVLLVGAGGVAVLAALPVLATTVVRLAAVGGALVLAALGVADLVAWSGRRTLDRQRTRLGKSADEALARRDELAGRGSDLAGARGAEDEARRRLAEDLAAAGASWSAWGLPSPATVSDAEAAQAELQRRLQRRDELKARIDETRLEAATAADEAQAAQTRLTALLKRLDVPADGAEAARVAEMVGLLAPHRVARDAVRTAEAACRNLELENARRAAAANLPAEDDGADLDAAIAAAADEAAAAADLREALGSLRQELRTVDAGHDLAEALAAEQAAQDALAGWCAQARTQIVESALLDDLRRQHDVIAAPPRLREANRLLDEFTRGRHALALVGGEAGAAFRVADRDADGHLDLDQLSDGTRAQVLLAVRVAFMAGMETDVRPPLFLDEALATSDPQRLAAVATCLGRLAAETGRQVFYLTSQPADVGAWRGALAHAGLAEPRILDLAVARSKGAAAGPDELAPSLPAPVPAPEGRGAAEYGALLGVRRFDPRGSWERTDTFHLAAPDLELAHRLRAAGLVTAGSLAAALPRLGTGGMLDEAGRRRLDRALNVLRAFVAAWRIGRPRAVTIGDIDRSGAVSDTFRPRVLELLAESSWNAARFLASAADGGIPRFQARKLDALREHLADAGCLDERPPLDDDQLVTEVLLRTGAAPDAEARTSVEEVRALVLRLLHAIPSAVADAPSSRPSSGSGPTG